MQDPEDLFDDIVTNERKEPWLGSLVFTLSVVALTVGSIVILWALFA